MTCARSVRNDLCVTPIRAVLYPYFLFRGINQPWPVGACPNYSPRQVVAAVHARYPSAPLLAVGYSLGEHGLTVAMQWPCLPNVATNQSCNFSDPLPHWFLSPQAATFWSSSWVRRALAARGAPSSLPPPWPTRGTSGSVSALTCLKNAFANLS